MLETIIQSRARIELLRVLLLSGGARFYVRELVKMTGLPQGSVQRELGNLEKAGVVLRERSGRQVYYRINDRCLIIPELRSIFVKTVGLADVLRASLAELSGRIAVAFVFGSVASGKERAESDVDLFVVGDVSLAQLSQALDPAERKLGREVNPVVFPAEEFRERLKTGDHFVTSVMQETKLFLIGGNDELRKLAE